MVLVLAFLLLFLLPGCNTGADRAGKHPATPTSQQPAATLAFRPPSPTPVLTRAPASTRTSTSTATTTFTPSPTFDPYEATISARVASIQNTQAYRMSVEVPATLAARNVQCKNGFVLERKMEILWVSSDLWTIFTCSPRPKNWSELWTPGVVDWKTRYTGLVKNDLSKTWIIPHDEYDGLVIDRPNAWLYPYHWTRDGKYVYLLPQYYPGGSGFPTSASIMGGPRELYRFNLESGGLETIFSYREHVFYSLSLSPDDQFLIYVDSSAPNIVHVVNMIDGDDRHIILDDDIAFTGSFAWGPDGTKVVFAAGYKKDSDDWQDDAASASLYVLTIKNMHAHIFLFKDPRILLPQHECDSHGCVEKWLDENTLYLVPRAYDIDTRYSNFIIDIRTGYLVDVSTPTPTKEPEVTLTPTP